MDVVQKLWGFCNTLRHDGINYGDYIEQLTYLLFLKLADEKVLEIPESYGWQDLRKRSGKDLLDRYQETLRELSGAPGLLGDIFGGSLSRFREPVNLKKLIDLIDETQWAELDVDLKGDAYEGLLQKFAAEQKGAGQYFTPRPLIRSIVRCVKPDIREASAYKVHDPACGTGGFLIGAAEWMVRKAVAEGPALKREDQRRMMKGTYSGGELVLETRRLALMNLFIHDIIGEINYGDSLTEGAGTTRYNVVLTNPPFGTKGAGAAPGRDDFMVETSNKQLNFIQHVLTILAARGQAAMVLPDNVLFEEHAGRDVRKLLMEDCWLHTILRLPVGTFSPYSTGVKANVLFFTKGPKTEEVWFYDARTDMPNVNKGQPLTEAFFADFERCYGPDPTPHIGKRKETERFKRYSREEIERRDNNLDIFWLKQDTGNGHNISAEPEELLVEIMMQLQIAMDAVNEMEMILSKQEVLRIGTVDD